MYLIYSLKKLSGERYDFVINADQPVGAYWIQARGLGECGNKRVQQLGILRYARGPYPVSYTHLDVYKRQSEYWVLFLEYKGDFIKNADLISVVFVYVTIWSKQIYFYRFRFKEITKLYTQ